MVCIDETASNYQVVGESRANFDRSSISVMPQSPHQENSFYDQLALFQEQQFTGRIDVQVPGSSTWSIYTVLGRFAWATGGLHSARRWQRHLLRNHLLKSAKTIQMRATDNFECRDYQLLTLLAKRRIATTETVIAVIRGIVHEVLFDILQAIQLSSLGSMVRETGVATEMALPFELRPSLGVRPSTSDTGILPRSWTVEMSTTLQMVEQTWHTWNHAGLALYSPNFFPILEAPERLQANTSPKLYRSLRELVNGKRSLNDLAVLLSKDVLSVTRSLLPYVRQGWIRLAETKSTIPTAVPAQAPPLVPYQSPESTPHRAPHRNASQNRQTQKGKPSRGVVVCIDDSPQVGAELLDILQANGYEGFWVSDAVQAIPQILKYQPDLVFLDLMMPIANGYEICSQIRRVSQFQNLPVVILTNNDGVVDRVRAKVVGATNFLRKPIEKGKILAATTKYITV